MSYLESPASQNEGDSLILKELKKGVSSCSDRLKYALKSGDISKFKMLEDKLKRKKGYLQSRIDRKDHQVLGRVWTSLALMNCTYNLSYNPTFFFPNLTGFWENIFIVDAVLLILLLGFTVTEEFIYQIINRRRRRNMTKNVSDEDETNETENDNLTNRYQKLVEDLNENYEPMQNLYERRFIQYAIYSFVELFCLLTIFIPSAIDIVHPNTENRLLRTLIGIFQLLLIIMSLFTFYYEFSILETFEF